jgi:hypothetical protein
MENYKIKEVENNGDIVYYNADRMWHRLDGPALIFCDKTLSWWLNGKNYRKLEHNRLVLFHSLEAQRFV